MAGRWISSYLLCLRPKKIYSVQRRNSSSTWYYNSNLQAAHRRRLTGSQARKKKAEKNKDVGDPIVLPGAPIDIKIRGNYAWVAGSDHVARKIDLQVYIHLPHALSDRDVDVGVAAVARELDGKNDASLQGPFWTSDILGFLRQDAWFWGGELPNHWLMGQGGVRRLVFR